MAKASAASASGCFEIHGINLIGGGEGGKPWRCQAITDIACPSISSLLLIPPCIPLLCPGPECRRKCWKTELMTAVNDSTSSSRLVPQITCRVQSVLCWFDFACRNVGITMPREIVRNRVSQRIRSWTTPPATISTTAARTLGVRY